MPIELEETLKDLHNSCPNVRANAIDQIGTLNPPQALQMILPFLVKSDEDSEVRLAAAFNLGEIHNDGAIPHLIRIFKGAEEEHEELRFYALRALREYQSVEILDGLVEEAYYGEASRSLREEVAHQLGNYDDENALQALISLLRTDDSHVIIATVDSLRKLNRLRLKSIWETILQEYFHPYICRIAADSLSELKSTSPFDLVLDWLNSHDYKKRRAAAYLLGDVQGASDETAIFHTHRVRCLMRALKDTAPSVRDVAITALAQYQHPEVGAYLRELAQEANLPEFVRESIAEQLASYNESDSMLNKLLEDESPIVQATAQVSLFILNEAQDSVPCGESYLNGKVPTLLDSLTLSREFY